MNFIFFTDVASDKHCLQNRLVLRMCIIMTIFMHDGVFS